MSNTGLHVYQKTPFRDEIRVILAFS